MANVMTRFFFTHSQYDVETGVYPARALSDSAAGIDEA
jgi:hypothetical protein